jgi:hypothetical protein
LPHLDQDTGAMTDAQPDIAVRVRDGTVGTSVASVNGNYLAMPCLETVGSY